MEWRIENVHRGLVEINDISFLDLLRTLRAEHFNLSKFLLFKNCPPVCQRPESFNRQ